MLKIIKKKGDLLSFAYLAHSFFYYYIIQVKHIL